MEMKVDKMPDVYFGSGERCVQVACELASQGKQVAVFMTETNRPDHWAIARHGVYGVCDADLDSEGGVAKACSFVEHQRFETLLFATHPNEDAERPKFLSYDQSQVEVIKAAAFTSMTFGRQLKLL